MEVHHILNVRPIPWRLITRLRGAMNSRRITRRREVLVQRVGVHLRRLGQLGRDINPTELEVVIIYVHIIS